MPNDTNTWTLIISTLLGGGVLGAIIKELFARGKTRAEEGRTRAEEKKTEAEAEKIKAEAAKILSELNPKESAAIGKNSSQELKGWFKSGSSPSDYDIGVDQNETFRRKPSGYIKSRNSPRGFGTVMQIFKAASYLNTRVRMTGSAKSEGVEESAAFWMRVDGTDKKTLSFDNMQGRPIKGATGWTKYQIVLEVPGDAVHIAFGLLLSGPGQVWLSDIQFDTVSSNVPTTDLMVDTDYPDKPVNLSFDE
jgi:hypothetical protein